MVICYSQNVEGSSEVIAMAATIYNSVICGVVRELVTHALCSVIDVLEDIKNHNSIGLFYQLS